MRTSREMRLTFMAISTFIAGSATSQQPFEIDTNFCASIQEVFVSSVAPMADGSLLLSGQIHWPGDSNPRGAAKLLADGTRDPDFPGFPQTTGGGKLTAWQGHYYVGVSQTVRRLGTEGLIDPSFISMNLGRYFSSIQGGDYHVFPDGRVLMSGAHILSDSIRGFEGMYNLIWFSNEGYLDTTRTHRYCDEVIFAIEEQPDGKFLCSGTMHTYEDQPVRCIFRIQPDGGLDPTFQADLQWGEAITFTTLTDGRILAGGPLKRIGSEDTLNLVRMMPDGSLDPSFVLNDFERSYDENALYLVSSITPMANGNMIVTGSFDRINGSDRGGIALLGPDGELLSELFEGTGCGMYEYVTPSGSSIYKSIRGIVSAPDGSYYIYGAYHGYDDGTTNDTAQRMVSRLHGLDVGEREDQDRNSAIHILPNPGTDKLTITTDLALLPGSIVQLVDAQGRVIAATTLASAQTGWYIGEVAPGCYVLRFLDGTHRTHAIKWVRTDR